MADQYWDVKVYNLNQAQADTAITLLNGLSPTGTAIRLLAWSPDDQILRLGVGGPDLSTFKTDVRNAIQAQFGQLPEFDLERSEPNDMDPKARVCSGADVAQGYNQFVDAYFASDLRAVGAGAYTNWIDPGDYYYRVRHGTNADGTIPSGAEIATALSQWSGIAQAYRWRIRLHHEGTKWEHDTISRLWVYYTDKIPRPRVSQVRAILEPDEFEYIGQTGQEACEWLNNKQAGLCAHFWPGGPPA